MRYYDYEQELVVLASLDASEAYEVDYTLIGYDKKIGQFVIVTASGCSCWDGECDVEYYPTISDLFKSLGIYGKDREFQPSLKGAEQLIEEVRKNMQFFPLGIETN